MLPTYIFGLSVVKYGILRNNRHGKLHAVIDYLPVLASPLLEKVDLIVLFYNGDQIKYSSVIILISLCNLAAMGKVQENI